jgi:Transglutaminase-like superfamily
MPIFIGPQSSSQPPRGWIASQRDWETAPPWIKWAITGDERYRGLSGPMYAAPLLDGDQGVAQTIAAMRGLVDQALRDPSIIRLATDIVRSVPAHDEIGEANTIYQWVLSNIRFTKDPVTKEKLYPPAELLKIRAGDCDDITMLVATLAMAVGYPARVVTVSANGAAPEQFSHVYPEVEVQGQWIPMDAARPDSMFGADPPMYYRKRAWSLTDDTYQDIAGTKVYAQPGSTVNLKLGAYPRFRSVVSGLGAYQRVRTMGQQDSWVLPIQQAVADVPAIIAAAKGTDPYASFQTVYTPGANAPYAGYQSPSSTPSIGILLVLGLGVMLLMGKL